MEINVNSKQCSFFQALASEMRLKIIEILKVEEKNIKELAELLGVSPTITARHIKQLEEVGIISTVKVSGKRGLQKVCRLNPGSVLLVFDDDCETGKSIKKFSIPVGAYTDYMVSSSCGLADQNSLIGIHDDPRYFSHPNHGEAGLVWFTHGWVEYRIPSYMLDDRKVKKISFSLELCSEYPHFKDDYKSDIYIFLNDKKIACWTSPGNFGDRRGKYNPPWWNLGSEYGKKIIVEINDAGSFVGNEKISDVRVFDLNIVWGKDMKLRILSPEKTENPGGINIFGKGFGDYDQDIDLKIEYY